MALINRVEVQPLESFHSGMARFYSPQSSNRTIVVEIPPRTVDDLFVHHFHTDQLLVVSGTFVLIILQNRQYQYLQLDCRSPTVVKIPPGVPHGGANLGAEPCILVNALIQHGPPHKSDYRPLKRPFPYDFSALEALVTGPLDFDLEPLLAVP